MDSAGQRKLYAVIVYWLNASHWCQVVNRKNMCVRIGCSEIENMLRGPTENIPGAL